MNCDKIYRLALRDKIPNKKNKKFLKWRAEQKRIGNDLHHILGQKHSDYLISEVNHKQHIINPNEFEFIDLLSDSINKMVQYIEFLESKNSKRN